MVLQTKTSVVIIAVLWSCMKLLSCSYSPIPVVEEKTDTLPALHGEDIFSLIVNSETYRLSAKVWDIYTNNDSSYWYFPKGIYLEKLDTLFRIEGYITADTAYFFEKTEKWQLIGHVHAQNAAGDIFKTSELFYCQQVPQNSIKAIFTDQYIKIQTKNKLITAYGMKANASMTEYTLYNNSFEAKIK